MYIMKTLMLAILIAAWPAFAGAQGVIEKKDVHIAVGGKASLYYLPLTIAEQLGYFKEEGLNLTISDFAGGSQALRAVVGGSADVVSGAYEHTLNMQPRASTCSASCSRGGRRKLPSGSPPPERKATNRRRTLRV